MNVEATDPEVLMLVGCSEVIEREFADRLVDPAWVDSPFSWIRKHKSAAVGAIGVRLVAAWCGVHDVSVTTSAGTKSDKLIGGVPVEIKFATLGKNGKYIFNQIRTAGYEKVLCMGLSPATAHCWIIPRQVAVQNARPQHGAETFMLQFDPQSAPEWLKPFGGLLKDAAGLLRHLRGKR